MPPTHRLGQGTLRPGEIHLRLVGLVAFQGKPDIQGEDLPLFPDRTGIAGQRHGRMLSPQPDRTVEHARIVPGIPGRHMAQKDFLTRIAHAQRPHMAELEKGRPALMRDLALGHARMNARRNGLAQSLIVAGTAQADFGQFPIGFAGLGQRQDGIPRHEPYPRQPGGQVVGQIPGQPRLFRRHHGRQRRTGFGAFSRQIAIGTKFQNGFHGRLKHGPIPALAAQQHRRAIRGQPEHAAGPGAGQVIDGQAGKNEQAPRFRGGFGQNAPALFLPVVHFGLRQTFQGCKHDDSNQV